ncbi:MAG: hypothetical protein U0Q12_17220 [Vicinamibacterales bacterium]
MSAAPRLRLAVIVDAPSPPAWVSMTLGELTKYAEIVLVVTAPGERAEMTHVDAVASYLHADQRLFSPARDITRPAPLSGLPASTEWLELGRIDASDFAGELSRRQVDAIIDLIDGVGSRSGPAPRLGWWRLSHAGTDSRRAAVWSVVRGYPTAKSALLSTSDPPRVLAESVSRTDHVSAARAQNSIAWKSLALVVRGVRRLADLAATGRGLEALATLASESDATGSTADLAVRTVVHVSRYARRRWHDRRHRRQWILVRGRREGPQAIYGLERVLPPDDHFWADPFLVEAEGRQWLFLEDYPYSRGRGHIAVAALDEDGRLGEVIPIIERPYHLSYPFVFPYEGEWYLIPESQGNNAIEVYRADRFPDQWRFSHTLMSGVRAADATLLEHGGAWWLFANIAEYEGSSSYDDLFVFRGDSPIATEWTPHPCNPVVSDVRRARAAGRFYSENGRLIRPSQDCAKEYGRAICLNEVVTLTDSEYEERCVGMIEATWDPAVVATHTITAGGSLVFLDGKLERRHGAPVERGPSAGLCQIVAPTFAP